MNLVKDGIPLRESGDIILTFEGPALWDIIIMEPLEPWEENIRI